MKSVVIFGGMFDPPHIGHAMDIDKVLGGFVCHEIWVAPSGARLDKEPQTKKEDRWAMTEIFCADYFSDAKIPVLPCRDELDMAPPTYTWAFYQLLLKKYPDTKFHFLLGSTNLASMRSWQHGEELFSTANFLIAPQGEHMNQYELPSNCVILEGTHVTTNISSTFIRDRMSGGLSPLPYVLPRIAGYIKENKLYR